VQTEDNTGDYYRSSSGIIPVRWTAPEGITSQKFSSASDVWSFGITCVEIFLDGGRPYPGVKSNPDVVRMVCTQGLVHPRPSGCPTEVYNELLKCWCADPDQRPDFDRLKAFFLAARATVAAAPRAGLRGAPGRAGHISVRAAASGSVGGEVYNLGYQGAGVVGGAGHEYNLGYQDAGAGGGAGNEYNLGYQDAGASSAGDQYNLGHGDAGTGAAGERYILGHHTKDTAT